MKILEASQSSIQMASDLIKNDGVVILPTDTLYGLCANALSDIAVSKVFKTKSRNSIKPLPIFVASIEQAKEYVEFNEIAYDLAIKYWPGALTLVLPIRKDSNLSKLIHPNTSSIAIRVPNAEVVLGVLNTLGAPITATSANLAGEADSLNVEDIMKKLVPTVELAIRNSFLPNKEIMASTIISCISTKPKLIRLGAVEVEF